MSGNFRLYIDDIGEAIRAQLWQALQTPLGLKLCMQGNVYQDPANQQYWSTLQLPSIFILNTDGSPEGFYPNGWERFVYNYSLTWVRKQVDGENPSSYRIAQQAVQQIVGAMASGGNSFLLDTGFGINGGTPDGLKIEHFFPRRWQVMHDIPLVGQQFFLSMAEIHVEVEATHNYY